MYIVILMEFVQIKAVVWFDRLKGLLPEWLPIARMVTTFFQVEKGNHSWRVLYMNLDFFYF